MQSKPEPTTFVAWSLDDDEGRLFLDAMRRTAKAGDSWVIPGLQAHKGDLWADEVLPQLRNADRVLAVKLRQGDWRAVFFLAGVAVGMGKPAAIIEQSPKGDPVQFEQDDRQREGRTGAIGTVYDWVVFDPPRPGRSVRMKLRPPTAAGTTFCVPDGMVGASLAELLRGWDQDWRVEIVKRRRWITEATFDTRDMTRNLVVVFPSPKSDAAVFATAFEVGCWCGAMDERRGTIDPARFRILRSAEAPPLQLLSRYEQAFSSVLEFENLVRPVPTKRGVAHSSAPKLLGLELTDFKCFEHLVIDLTLESILEGDWTCIAGINGAGKSAILQAITLVLLGPRHVEQLGSELLRRMCRRVGDEGREASIRARIQTDHGEEELFLPLHPADGLDGRRLYSHSAYSRMLSVWAQLDRTTFLAYGATRNLSERVDNRYDNLNPRVRRQMTLFDPLTQIARADVLLRASSPALEVARQTLRALIDGLLSSDRLRLDDGSEAGSALELRFRQGAASVGPVELPDGYRSTVAWLADLAAAWHEDHPDAKPGKPEAIEGIVLLDEIDLHLHANLQRSLVPNLRKLLPKVQWIVTTHVPLVIASFDRNEIVVLDRDAEGGVRELDRQVLGFSTDDVYSYLMQTEPNSAAIDDALEAAGPEDYGELAALIMQDGKTSEAEARSLLESDRGKLARLRAARKS